MSDYTQKKEQCKNGSRGIDGTNWCIPCNYTRVSSPFGWRIHPVYGDERFHYGVDLSAGYDVPIYAVKDGTVIEASYGSSNGNYVTIRHDGTNFQSKYLHMGYKSIGNDSSDYTEKNDYKHIVYVGKKVEIGEHIGFVGSTGVSTGPHLHFSILLNGNHVDPMDYIGGASVDLGGIDDSLRFDIPENEDTDWTPLEVVTGSLEGSPKQFHIRRGKLLEMSYVPLYVNNKFYNELYVGHGFFGLNSNYTTDETSIDISDDDWEVATNNNYSKDNLGYCVARANQLLSPQELSFLPSISDKNWYEYNMTNNLFEYGKLPSAGSIICWTNVKDNTTKAAIVEQVLGSDLVEISKYEGNEIITANVSNSNKNWEQNKNEYKFSGFIHLLGNSNSNTTINNNGINFNLSSGGLDTYHSFVIGIHDVKHINSVKVKYAVKNGSSGNLYVCLSQNIWNYAQLGSAESEMNPWPPDVNSYYLPSIEELTKYSYPFPNGCLTIGSIDASKNGVHNDTYEINAEAFKPSSEHVPFIRNANTYLSFILKVSANKSADITLQEIILCG